MHTFITATPPHPIIDTSVRIDLVCTKHSVSSLPHTQGNTSHHTRCLHTSSLVSTTQNPNKKNRQAMPRLTVPPKLHVSRYHKKTRIIDPHASRPEFPLWIKSREDTTKRLSSAPPPPLRQAKANFPRWHKYQQRRLQRLA